MVARVPSIPTNPPSSLQLPEGLFEIGIYQGPTPDGSAGSISVSINDFAASTAYTGFVIYDGGVWRQVPLLSMEVGAVIPPSGYIGFVGVGGVQLNLVDNGDFDADNSLNGAISFIGGPTVAVGPQQPGAPTGLSATRVVPTKASISFSPPANDGGATITSYTATCTSPAGDASGSSASSPIAVVGLVATAAYTCRVTATNSAGTGNPSTEITVAPPATLSATGSDGTTVTLSTPNGVNIVSFANSSVPPSAPPAGTFLPQGVFEFVLDGVTPGAAVPVSIAYTPKAGVTITGWSKYINSQWKDIPANLIDTSTPGRVTFTITDNGEFDSDPAAGVIRDPIAPVAAITLPQPPQVTGVSATTNLTSGAVVSFTPITALNGSGQPQYGTLTYDAACTSTNGGAAGSASGSTSPITVGGLTARKQYRCTVTALNIEQSGPASAQSTALTVPGLPDAPTNVNISRYPDQIVVTYSLPFSDGGSTLTGFTATCTSPDAPTLTHTEGLPGSLTVTIQMYDPVAAATYTCSVFTTNGVGSTAPSAPITVLPTPPAVSNVAATLVSPGQLRVSFDPVADPLGRDLTFNPVCTVVGGTSGSGAAGPASPIVVSGLTAGPAYECSVRTSAGTSVSASYSAWSTPSAPVATADPPSAPTTVTGTRPTAGTAVISFGAPANNGGAPVIDYTATCSAPGGPDATTTGTASPLEVTGLANTATYTCVVRARNLAGTGPASSTVALPFGAAPDAPTISTAPVGFDDDRDALIVFTAPAFDGGRPITSYSVTCTSTNGGATITRTGPASPVQVNGLSPNRSYRCRVAAVNDIGTGALSGQTAAFTTPTAPGRPTGATAVVDGNRRVSVSYTQPAYIGASPINRNTLRCESSDGGVTVAGVTGTTNPLVATGLTAGKTYTCRVSAQNSFGSSVGSEPTLPFFVLGLPAAPQSPSAVTNGSTKATVSYLAPGPNGSDPVTGYTTTCTSSTGGAAKTVAVTTPVTSISVTGLTAGATYTCAVRATNSAGTGPAATTTPFTLALPGQPTGVTVTTTGTTARVAFVPAAANGSDPVIDFSATCTPTTTGVLPKTVNGTTSPISITGLAAGATYTCTVTARAGMVLSPVSAPSAPFTLTLPTAPTDVIVTMAGVNATVTFVSPAGAGGDPVTSHAVSCTSSTGGTTKNTTVNMPATSATLTGLTAGATYTCTVTARSAVGAGPAGTSPSFVVPTVPGAPGTPTATADSTGTGVVVRFGTPASNGGSAITSYRVTCTPAGGGTARTVSGARSPLVVTSLTAGTTYTCSVAAINAVGAGTASTVSVTTQGVLAAPTGLDIELDGSGRAVIATFTPISSGGGLAVTSYRVTCTPAGGGTARTATVAGGLAVVTGLAATTPYNCTVASTNAAGTGAASAPVSVTTT